MTTADVVVEGLVRQGVRHLFGMPGSHSTTIYDALARNGSIATVLIRNEQAGAFAADGYARVSGRPGVICTTAGPGATNALTGVAEAWADSVPLLLMAGQVNSDRLHQECGAYHEIDLEGIFRPVTRWCRTIREGDEIPPLIIDAFRSMTHGRPRPAALILPQDLMAGVATWREPPLPRPDQTHRFPAPRSMRPPGCSLAPRGPSSSPVGAPSGEAPGRGSPPWLIDLRRRWSPR